MQIYLHPTNGRVERQDPDFTVTEPAHVEALLRLVAPSSRCLVPIEALRPIVLGWDDSPLRRRVSLLEDAHVVLLIN